MWGQFTSFSVGLYCDDQIIISTSICVSTIGHIPMVGIHSIAKDFSTELISLYIPFDATNNLAKAFDEAEDEFNKIVPELKSSRKFKEGVLVQQAELEYLMHQNIAEHCGHSHL